MEEATAFASAQSRFSQAFNNFNTVPATNGDFVSQLDPSLNPLENGNAFPAQFAPPLDTTSPGQAISLASAYAQRNGAPLQQYQELENRSIPAAQQSQRQPPQGQSGEQHQPFGMLVPNAQAPSQPIIQQPAIQSVQQDASNTNDDDKTPKGRAGKKETSHFSGMKKILNPPDLIRWRQRLFDIEDTIVMSEQEFQIYFPHVDNVYSHRSTQRYKRKPFISHYWDCRMKGRPAGTPKSTDPSVKKRKRLSRQRDLCDVKIKITEYLTNEQMDGQGDNTDENGQSFFPIATNGSLNPGSSQGQTFGIPAAQGGSSTSHPGANGQKYFTIQRVNGQNASGIDTETTHRHSLEDSDRIKKNSILRELAKEAKDQKKIHKTQSKRATGAALATVKRRSKENELKLFGSCYCPFVQRVWIALELKGVDYQYIEVPDLYDKPKLLLDINPRGLVPAIRHGDWGCYESTVLLEYLEDLDPTHALFPSHPQQKAMSRLWSDHINRHLVPSFYRYLQAQDHAAQAATEQEFRDNIDKLVSVADPEGPFFLGKEMSMVDVQLAPWLLRTSRVLKPYRNWPDPEEGSRWKTWVDAVEATEEVKRTVSGPEVYVDSYQRYAENRPNTSQVASAVNGGRALP